MCRMLTINIDLLTVIVFHPYTIVHRRNVAPYVVGDVDCYRLRLSDASNSLPETQEALGIMALILIGELSPHVCLLFKALVVWGFCYNDHHNENHFWVCINFFLDLCLQQISVLGECALDKHRNFRNFRVR